MQFYSTIQENEPMTTRLLDWARTVSVPTPPARNKSAAQHQQEINRHVLVAIAEAAGDDGSADLTTDQIHDTITAEMLTAPGTLAVVEAISQLRQAKLLRQEWVGGMWAVFRYTLLGIPAGEVSDAG